MRIINFGCVGPEGLTIELDDIVCLVGVNNCGKSTVLRAYEAAVLQKPLTSDLIHSGASGQPASVELWVHIPKGVANIDEAWKEVAGSLRLVRSKWEWPSGGGAAIRTTWDPATGQYSANGKAAGLDEVFNSRLPRPFRIESLENPTNEHKRLLTLVLEPLKTKLAAMAKDKSSQLYAKIAELEKEANLPVAAFAATLDEVQKKVNKSYQRVFGDSFVQFYVSLGSLDIDPASSLLTSSYLQIAEPHGASKLSQQGTGSQRALFWSMLEVRSALNRELERTAVKSAARASLERDIAAQEKRLATLKREETKEDARSRIEDIKKRIEDLDGIPSGAAAVDDLPLPGFMLLIDEPETALHPAAIRAAKDHLYSLASEAGWQVMMSTHHPAFIDPLKDHTTIVRLHRSDPSRPPNVYRSDDVSFVGDEAEQLKCIMACDSTVAEMFFAPKVIVVEGDTEHAAFNRLMDSDPTKYPQFGRPLILKARGKWTIPVLIKVLSQFKIAFAVVHDADSPKNSSGKPNAAYRANAAIAKAVKGARSRGISVIYRVHVPEFERNHGIKRRSKDKPFHAWSAVSGDPVRSSVLSMLDVLCGAPWAGPGEDPDDGISFEPRLKTWAASSAGSDKRFVF